MDLYHLLSAVVGAFAGLVFYTVITPGHLPDEAVVEPSDPRLDLRLQGLAGKRDADGYFRVGGQVFNTRAEPCQRALVAVVFRDGEQALSRKIATLEAVPPGKAHPFEVRAYVPGATAFDATVELAQF